MTRPQNESLEKSVGITMGATFSPPMNSEIQSLHRSLRQRQAELRELIRQMKSDHLNRGAVFKTLEAELSSVAEQLRENVGQEKR